MKEAKGFQEFYLVLSQIIFSPLVQVLVYKYVAVTQHWTLPAVSVFRTLGFLYLIPFFVGLIIFLYTLISKFNNVNSGPFYMRVRQMAVLSVLSVAGVVLDYLAIVAYSAYGSVDGLEFRLPFFLLVKLTLTPLFSHLAGTLVLNRFFVSQTLFYAMIQVLGILIYEVTIFDQHGVLPETEQISGAFFGGFKFYVPSIYLTMIQISNPSGDIQYFQWLPHFLIIASSFCNGLIPVLTKSFLIKHAHGLKLQQYQDQKTKLKEGQLNVQFIDQDMLLKPKLVTMTSQVFKRYQHLYTQKNKDKKGAAQSQKLYKEYTEGYLHSKMYKKVFSKTEEDEDDPVTQALSSYKKEVVMDTEEEEKLERLQIEREKIVGTVSKKMERLPQNGYSLYGKFRQIEEAEFEYRQFREALKKKRASFKELDALDEMINDFNYM